MKVINNTFANQQKSLIMFFVGLFFIICTGSSSIFAQTIIVDYVFATKNSIKKDTTINKGNKVYDKLNVNLLNSIHFRLIHSDKKSIFLSSQNTPLFSDVAESDLAFLEKYKISDFTSVTYKDFKKKHILQREYILDKAYVIDDDLLQYQWEILADEKIIDQFNCKLAKTKDAFGTAIFAWFTTDIQVLNGPSIYHGLPGLIVEIHSDTFTFSIRGIKIIKSNSPLFFKERGEKISQANFVALFDKKMKNWKRNK